MNIFDKAMEKAHLNNMPSVYIVTRNKKTKIKVSYIKEFWCGGESFTDSIYGSDFETRLDFEIYLYKHFKEVTKIILHKPSYSESYYLKNGYLHNINSYAYSLKKDNNVTHKYFIRGREFGELDFKIFMRNNKMERLLGLS